MLLDTIETIHNLQQRIIADKFHPHPIKPRTLAELQYITGGAVRCIEHTQNDHKHFLFRGRTYHIGPNLAPAEQARVTIRNLVKLWRPHLVVKRKANSTPPEKWSIEFK